MNTRIATRQAQAESFTFRHQAHHLVILQHYMSKEAISITIKLKVVELSTATCAIYKLARLLLSLNLNITMQDMEESYTLTMLQK